MTEITSQFLNLDNIRLHYLVAQPDTFSTTIIFLHGFPEHAHVWESYLSFFGKNAQAVALDLPGYNLSQAPDELSGFEVPALVNTVANFIRHFALSHKQVVLVAHDWGGAIAWPLANRYPDLLSHLIIINAAHPSTFTREMIENPKQRLMSDYIHDFQDPEAEKWLSDNRFKRLKAKSIGQMNVVLTDAEMRQYEAAWSKPGVMTAMLNYYRCMPQLFPRDDTVSGPLEKNDKEGINVKTKSLLDLKVPHITISVPTLVVWGEQDEAFDIGVLKGLNRYVEELQEVRFSDATHWIHHEKTNEICCLIEGFISHSSS